jgi:hypothetical protein
MGGDPSWPVRTVELAGGWRVVQAGENTTGRATRTKGGAWLPWVPANTSQTQPTGAENVNWRRIEEVPASTYTYTSSVTEQEVLGAIINNTFFTQRFRLLPTSVDINPPQAIGHTNGPMQRGTLRTFTPRQPSLRPVTYTVPEQSEFQYEEPGRYFRALNRPDVFVQEPITRHPPSWSVSGIQNVPFVLGAGTTAANVRDAVLGVEINNRPTPIGFRDILFSPSLNALVDPPPLQGTWTARLVTAIPSIPIGGDWRRPFDGEDITGRTTIPFGTVSYTEWTTAGAPGAQTWRAPEWRHPAPAQNIAGRPTRTILRANAAAIRGLADGNMLTRGDAHGNLFGPWAIGAGFTAANYVTEHVVAGASAIAVHVSPGVYGVLVCTATGKLVAYKVNCDSFGTMSVAAGPVFVGTGAFASVMGGDHDNTGKGYFVVDAFRSSVACSYAVVVVDFVNMIASPNIWLLQNESGPPVANDMADLIIFNAASAAPANRQVIIGFARRPDFCIARTILPLSTFA